MILIDESINHEASTQNRLSDSNHGGLSLSGMSMTIRLVNYLVNYADLGWG